MSVAFVMIVAGMGMVMLQIHSSQSRRQVQATDQKRALYIAEAGLAEAFFALAQGKSGNVGTEEIPAQYANGVYWVEATAVDGGQVGLVSTGLCGTGRFALSMVLERQIDPIASLGFYAGQDVIVGEGAIIDGFDSSLGSLSEQLDPALDDYTTGEGGLLSAIGDITFEGNFASGSSSLKKKSTPAAVTILYGNAHPGPQGVVSQGTEVVITGSTTPARKSVKLTPAAPPEITNVAPWPLGPGGGTIPSGEFKTTIAEVESRGLLTITGPAVVVFDELRIKAGAELQVDSSEGQVALFVQEFLEFEKGCRISNVSEDPTGFVLFANGTEWIDRDGDRVPDSPIVFEPTGKFLGYLYAPGADLQLSSDLHVIGGVACQNLTIAEGGRLTFDTALANSNVTLAGLPKLIAWRIVALPDSDLTRNRMDPVHQLELLGVTPTKSADAHGDTYIHLKYYDVAGDMQAYNGPVAELDWTNVDAPIAVMWDDDPVIGDEGQEWHVPSPFNTNLDHSQFQGHASGFGVPEDEHDGPVTCENGQDRRKPRPVKIHVDHSRLHEHGPGHKLHERKKEHEHDDSVLGDRDRDRRTPRPLKVHGKKSKSPGHAPRFKALEDKNW